MKRLLLAGCAVLTLAGCSTYGGMGFGGGYGAGIAYDGYYDNSYGPIYDGYWGDGDVFYYRSSHHGRYIADTGHHFRRDQAAGFNEMHVHGPDMTHRGHHHH